jgi:hypothetical protein
MERKERRPGKERKVEQMDAKARAKASACGTQLEYMKSPQPAHAPSSSSPPS